jgi:hypothetical protein
MPGVPETLGPYELLDALGSGAQGTVWRARHRVTGTIRAVKRLEGPFDPESVERFRREAQALARSGGAAVTIHEIVVEPGELWYAMELCPGGSLERRLEQRGRFEWREAVSIMAKVARALDRCHEQDLLHRDLKPANILFDERDEPRLADWGLVKDLARSKLTETGTVVGTPTYMAPEQLAGRSIDRRADVFALGVILHELVAGNPPFGGDTLPEIVRARTRGGRDPLAKLGAPRELDLVLDRALAARPAARIASARELASELDRLLAGARRRRSALIPLGLAALGVASVSLAAALLPGPPFPASPARPDGASAVASSARPLPRSVSEAREVAKRLGEMCQGYEPLRLETPTEQFPMLRAYIGRLVDALPVLVAQETEVKSEALAPLSSAARTAIYAWSVRDACPRHVAYVDGRFEVAKAVLDQEPGLAEWRLRLGSRLPAIVRGLPVELLAAIAASRSPLHAGSAFLERASTLAGSDPILCAAAYVPCIDDLIDDHTLKGDLGAALEDDLARMHDAAESLLPRAVSPEDRIWAKLIRRNIASQLGLAYRRIPATRRLREQALLLLQRAFGDYPLVRVGSEDVTFDGKAGEDARNIATAALYVAGEQDPIGEDLVPAPVAERLAEDPIGVEILRRRPQPELARALRLLDAIRPGIGEREGMPKAYQAERALVLRDLGKVDDARACLADPSFASLGEHDTLELGPLDAGWVRRYVER